MEQNVIVNLAPSEMLKVIEENAALKAALQKATAAFLYANGARDESLPEWDVLPEESYLVRESVLDACNGGFRSGRATYMAQAADTAEWLRYWKVA